MADEVKIMQCQVCNKKEATIHLTEINDGVRSEMHICEHCAHQEGLSVHSQVPINELLTNLLSVQPTDEELFGPADESESCPHCGFTLESFKKEAMLGCPEDYQVFEKSLAPLIQKAQNGQTVHCGKVPSRTPIDTKQQMKLTNLKNQLDSAIKAEDYETAAKLRDKIAELES